MRSETKTLSKAAWNRCGVLCVAKRPSGWSEKENGRPVSRRLCVGFQAGLAGSHADPQNSLTQNLRVRWSPVNDQAADMLTARYPFQALSRETRPRGLGLEPELRCLSRVETCPASGGSLNRAWMRRRGLRLHPTSLSGCPPAPCRFTNLAQDELRGNCTRRKMRQRIPPGLQDRHRLLSSILGRRSRIVRRPGQQIHRGNSLAAFTQSVETRSVGHEWQALGPFVTLLEPRSRGACSYRRLTQELSLYV